MNNIYFIIHFMKKIPTCELIGKNYWRLTILWEKESLSKRYMECVCNCWNKCDILLESIRKWNTKSCWCLSIENRKTINLKHWMSRTKLYHHRENMKWRCNVKTRIEYKSYWWRWIKYDIKWEKFEWFYEDMWKEYKEWLELDRINVDMNYCKENCRWVSHKEQQNNKRCHHYIIHNWLKMNIAQWRDYLWLKSSWTIYYHIDRWDVEKWIKKYF